MYQGDVDGYFTQDFVDVIYAFQIDQGVVTSIYDAGA